MAHNNSGKTCDGRRIRPTADCLTSNGHFGSAKCWFGEIRSAVQNAHLVHRFQSASRPKEARPTCFPMSLESYRACAEHTPIPWRRAIRCQEAWPLRHCPLPHWSRTSCAKTPNASMEWWRSGSPHDGAKSNHAQKRPPDVSETPGQAARENFSRAAGNGSRVRVTPDEASAQVLCPSL